MSDSDDVDMDADRKIEEDMKIYQTTRREKHARYLEHLKGDFVFVKDKSATVTIQFDLEYKKLLILSIAEKFLQKCLVRNVNGIERCMFVPPQRVGAEPYLFV